MKCLVVADIFGRTAALEALAQALPFETIILDPYNGEYLGFASEALAYAYFTAHVGLEGYSQLFNDRLAQQSGPVSLLGFSVGASVIWLNSALYTQAQVHHGVCFYGSQIRNYADIVPSFPMTLVFPKREAHFCVANLMTQLAGKRNVRLHQAPYLHGFMNQHSTHFDPEGYQGYLDKIPQ
jgi:hypothetical protein